MDNIEEPLIKISITKVKTAEGEKFKIEGTTQSDVYRLQFVDLDFDIEEILGFDWLARLIEK